MTGLMLAESSWHIATRHLLLIMAPEPIQQTWKTSTVSVISPEAIITASKYRSLSIAMQRQPPAPAPVTPSCIIPPGTGVTTPHMAGGLQVDVGGLYHGSFRTVMNTDFLKKERVTHIVNTAKGLDVFGQKYTVSCWDIKAFLLLTCNFFYNLCAFFNKDAVKYAKKELKIEFLELNWEDIVSYVIKDDDLVQCARFIHRARTSSGSVLVHCIQVRSQHFHCMCTLNMNSTMILCKF